MAQIELIPFIPETASYQIWHPKDFIINKDEDGIVTITSPQTNSNLTLSSYYSDQLVNEKMLFDFFRDKAQDYTPTTEEKSIATNGRIWLEREFLKDGIFWVWWALSNSNRIILAFVNSDDILSTEDRHLYMSMIDKMEIYPEEDEE